MLHESNHPFSIFPPISPNSQRAKQSLISVSFTEQLNYCFHVAAVRRCSAPKDAFDQFVPRSTPADRLSICMRVPAVPGRALPGPACGPYRVEAAMQHGKTTATSGRRNGHFTIPGSRTVLRGLTAERRVVDEMSSERADAVSQRSN